MEGLRCKARASAKIEEWAGTLWKMGKSAACLGVSAAKVPTSFDELRGGARGRLKLHNFRRTPPQALPDSKRELQRAVADLYRWGAICRSGIELFLMKATWKPWFVCGNRTRNSVKRYEQLYRGAENPAYWREHGALYAASYPELYAAGLKTSF